MCDTPMERAFSAHVESAENGGHSLSTMKSSKKVTIILVTVHTSADPGDT